MQYLTKVQVPFSDVPFSLPLSHRFIEDDTHFTFAEKTVSISDKKGKLDFPYSIDSSTSPKGIDLKGQHGIYEVQGDVLRLCYSIPAGTRRPQRFTSTPDLQDAKYFFFTLTRDANPSAASPEGSKRDTRKVKRK